MSPVSRVTHPFLAGPGPRALAHRGWHTGALDGLENTLAAFARAVDEGYTHVETDARATSDGVLVLHHDATLRRTTGHPGEIARTPHAELGELLVDGREPVPTLEETLRALPRTRVLVDVKADGGVLPVLDVLERTDAWDRVCLAAFSDTRLARLRRLAGPRLLTSAGPRGVAALRARSVLPLPGWGRHRRAPVVQVPLGAPGLALVDHRFLAQAHREGTQVDVWTVDDPTQVRRVLDLGVDGIITDAPDVLRDELRARGAWLR